MAYFNDDHRPAYLHEVIAEGEEGVQCADSKLRYVELRNHRFTKTHGSMVMIRADAKENG